MNARSPVGALLIKDVRLSLDTLLPWGLIVAGFGVVAAAISRLPESMAPDVLGRFTLGDALDYTAIVVGGTAVAVGAWVAAVVSQGDRIHGAEHLMAAMPVPALRRVASKLAAVALAAAAPVIVATLCFLMARTLVQRDATPRDDSWWLLAATGGAAFVGAALGLGVSPIVRGPFRVVAIALLLGALGGLLGLLASWFSFERAAAELMSLVRARRGDDWTMYDGYHDSRAGAAIVSTITGVATIAMVALCVGAFAMAAPRRPRSIVAVLAAGLALAVVTGAAATFVSFRQGVGLQRNLEWASWRVAELDDETLIRGFWSAYGPEPTDSVYATVPLMWALPGEMARRLAAVAPSERSSHPLMQALMEVQDNSTADRAMRTVPLLPPGPEAVDRLLDAMRRYPDQRNLLVQRVGGKIPGVVDRLGVMWDQGPRELGTDRRLPTDDEIDELTKNYLRAMQDVLPEQRAVIQSYLDEMAGSSTDAPTKLTPETHP